MQETRVHSLSQKIPGEENDTPLQYSCLENPMDGGAWKAAVHGVAKSWTRLSDFTSLQKDDKVISYFYYIISFINISF